MKFFLLTLTIISTAMSDDVSVTRAVGAKGTVLCGSKPIEGAHIYLLRMNSEDKKQIMDARVTSDSGMFHLEGNTFGRPANESTITPVVRIFHRCGVEDKNSRNYRRWQFQIPMEYVNNGRRARKSYEAGNINLELKYPKEKKVTFEP